MWDLNRSIHAGQEKTFLEQEKEVLNIICMLDVELKDNPPVENQAVQFI